jgi:hypothetical protein
MKIQVCTWKTCKERFSEYILARLERDKQSFGLDNLMVESCPCTGNCKDGPNLLVDGKLEIHCNPIKASKFALQSKQKSKKWFVLAEDKQKRAHFHSTNEESSAEETLYFKDHITLVKKTSDDSSDI